jgi:hypothetical protein
MKLIEKVKHHCKYLLKNCGTALNSSFLVLYNSTKLSLDLLQSFANLSKLFLEWYADTYN